MMTSDDREIRALIHAIYAAISGPAGERDLFDQEGEHARSLTREELVPDAVELGQRRTDITFVDLASVSGVKLGTRAVCALFRFAARLV